MSLVHMYINMFILEEFPKQHKYISIPLVGDCI